ncbi:mitochondrial ribosomal protein L21 [Arctopsyche grandis]|uniref:mitochondrial ribosomal protein L21 n=1 Tax=Arctopsyche grandis TaxID=121162 RepID=UPI00406D91E8
MALLNLASKISSIVTRSAGSVISKLYSTSLIPISQRGRQPDESIVRTKSTEEVDRIINTVNQLAAAKLSRNFAIIQVRGKQYKVTDGDLLIVEGFWPPNIGDKLRLDKVVFAGTKDFSLIGLPLVQPGLVDVIATIIGKEMSYTKTRFRKKKRKQFMRINFIRKEQTMMRINCVKIGSNLNQPTNTAFN